LKGDKVYSTERHLNEHFNNSSCLLDIFEQKETGIG